MPQYRRLTIAIDCDDVLVHTTERLIDTYNSQYGTSVKLAHAYLSNNDEWGAERDEVFRRIVAIQRSDEYAAVAPSEQTIAVIKRLARRHELHLVTARFNEVMSVTTRMLDTYFPDCFTGIEHVGPDRPKGEVCRTIGANVMVDDSFHHLESAATSGVERLVWFGNYPWQGEENFEMLPAVRCRDWLHVEKALKLNG